MTALDWPKLAPADRDGLCAELDSLIGQIVDQDMHALDTLDDQFARMAAALLALLRAHEPDDGGRCGRCPSTGTGCEVLATIQEHLKQPQALLWWQIHRERGEPMSLDEVGAWLAASQTPRPWD